MKYLIFIFLMAGVSEPLFAQHEHHMDMGNMQMPKDSMASEMPKDAMASDKHKMHMSMSHVYSLNLPMNRNGSGTAWLPDASPMYGYMIHNNGWMFMIHGDIFIRYNKQDLTEKGSRGDSKIDAPDMLMLMGQKQVGENGLFHFNTMFSTDALVAGGSGYPLLFQTGESWEGKPLVDRQHPHDLFSELSVSYSQAFSKKMDAYVYLGYPGEPALGPVVFMHRPASMFNPDAPIGHHWQDATHITFGVATIGLRFGKFKIEGSSFTGREPDENRYNFDKPLFDSRSGRLSFNPSKNWALQVSRGFIKSPEALHPLEDITRTTASAIYSKKLQNDVFINASAVWGMNKQADEDASNSILLEGNVKFTKVDVYSRYEWVQKSAEELALNEFVYGVHTLYPVQVLTGGLSYDILDGSSINMAIGGQLSFYHADNKLDALYGKNPIGGEIYLHFYPKLMR